MDPNPSQDDELSETDMDEVRHILPDTVNVSSFSRPAHSLYPVAFTRQTSPSVVSCLGFDCPLSGIPDLPVPLIGRANCLNRLITTYTGLILTP